MIWPKQSRYPNVIPSASCLGQWRRLPPSPDPLPAHPQDPPGLWHPCHSRLESCTRSASSPLGQATALFLLDCQTARLPAFPGPLLHLKPAYGFHTPGSCSPLRLAPGCGPCGLSPFSLSLPTAPSHKPKTRQEEVEAFLSLAWILFSLTPHLILCISCPTSPLRVAQIPASLCCVTP